MASMLGGAGYGQPEERRGRRGGEERDEDGPELGDGRVDDVEGLAGHVAEPGGLLGEAEDGESDVEREAAVRVLGREGGCGGEVVGRPGHGCAGWVRLELVPLEGS